MDLRHQTLKLLFGGTKRRGIALQRAGSISLLSFQAAEDPVEQQRGSPWLGLGISQGPPTLHASPAQNSDEELGVKLQLCGHCLEWWCSLAPDLSAEMPAPVGWVFLVVCAALGGWQAMAGSLPPPCDSHIYCTGELLRQVQRARLFQDDKDFVDMPLKSNPDVVLKQFEELMKATPGGDLSKLQLAQFVEAHFFPPGQELESWMPPDWTDSIPLFKRISDEKLRTWAWVLNAKWKQLGRQVNPDVQTSPWRYSLIYVPNPVIVPGGRFREYYYWDSFWILGGLLLSNMTATAKGLIQNFLYLVSKFGHVPNGGRVYYERRSQPPLLTLMMESYLSHTNDTEFLRENLHLLEAEYHFWQDHRAVNISVGGKQYSLNHYNVQVGEPRPESYMKDVELAMGLEEEAQQNLWAELQSAAESGWDFSSRWFLPGFPSLHDPLQDTQVRGVVPVDLNAILCKVEQLLATFYQVLGRGEKASRFWAARRQRAAALTAVLWNEEAGVWLDYRILHQRHNPAFYPSNISPLWAECDVDLRRAEKALCYLEESSALSYANGLPTSLTRTGQQWDFPNAWAPLQHMVIIGLAKSSSPRAQELAFSLAQHWLRMNLAVYKKHGGMFEKEGFGWTNGVALQLLDLYGERLTAASALCSPTWPCVGACLILILFSQLPGLLGDRLVPWEG
ncbi:trehalase isoform X2 [Ahaetulla prasina]|uniref:trehalase isoform X2 n=1 Tax=Ahaetulla prasina TaxID=499056 RepID=UPI002647EA4F|nr:trehalase isoform X2 [Ahaetulla prasina]